jgi:hypothetical protein
MIMDDMKCHAYDCHAKACVTPGCYKLVVIAVCHKGLGMMSDSSSLGLIRRDLPSNETVEVRNAPVGFKVG